MDHLTTLEIHDEEPAPRRKKSEKPKPRSRPQPAARPAPPAVISQPPSPAANFFITMAFLILAILAFYLGLATKHRGAGHGSLWDDMFGTSPVEETK